MIVDLLTINCTLFAVKASKFIRARASRYNQLKFIARELALTVSSLCFGRDSLSR